MHIEQLKKLYSGFILDGCQGNNSFSYEQRSHRSLVVPPLHTGCLADVRCGKDIVFAEVEDGRDVLYTGLEALIYTEWEGKPVVIFDNHNHAFFFWMAAYQAGVIPAGGRLCHIDQHTDMREPDADPPSLEAMSADLRLAFNYTNFDLNVGNFIRPALHTGLFHHVDILQNSQDFVQDAPPADVLDLDLDIFAPELDYIDYSLKSQCVLTAARHARLITIATSPFFLDQAKAVRLVQQLFSSQG